MNAERYQKIKKIFTQAAEMSVAEREDFLESACDSDTLRREVEKMLAFADAEDGEDTFEKNAFEIFTGGNHAKLPEKIGNYKILREIGRGGMGAVYEAVREADNFTQKVALKVIKRGMDTDAILRRFRHEQKILATLEHANIARFLDGGMTDDGLPFYAMEYVEGEFIDDYCRARNLSLNDRLRLFRQVCAAVQYAHQNLVIHRDLKSKNILVTADGEPKLLDFGIATVLTPETAHEIGTATQFGMMT
ncbi:MAG TPA: serine/threonine-protein kinase, partial [Pyrinomonadaceae bacterium]